MSPQLNAPSRASAATGSLPARSWPLVASGATALLLGLLIYLLLRPAWPAVLPFWLTGSAPSFLHAFAFALWTALALDARGGRLWAVVLGWGLLEAAIEAMQHPALHARLPFWAAQHWGGTFDGLDVAAVLMGSALAGALATRAKSRLGD